MPPTPPTWPGRKPCSLAGSYGGLRRGLILERIEQTAACPRRGRCDASRHHGIDGDEFFAEEDPVAARALSGSTPDAELFVYFGDKHLFSAAGLSSYHEVAAKPLPERRSAFSP
jgi:hypothetical protein